jgi:hypothetical protein
MTALSATHTALWFLSAVFALDLSVGAQAQNRPITIPPAAQIAPPAPVPPPPPAAPLGIAPAPRALLPASVETVRDPQGAGIVMYGQLSGKADSALAVGSAIFAYSQAFDPLPAPLLAVADKNDRSAQSLFAATVHGVTVLGVAVVALSDAGGNVSVFYDYPDSFAASFPRLQQALGPGRADTGLTPLHLADGSEISVAPGWRVLGQGKGLIDLAGPQGEFMSLGDTIPVYAGATALAGSVAQGPCCDPVAALQAAFPQIAANAQRRGLPPLLLTGIVDSAATAAPTGGRGALILATVSLGGRAYSYLTLAEAIGGFSDPWTLRLSGVMAPQPVFAAELPRLLQMWTSHSANPQGLAASLKAAAQSIAALEPMLQPATEATQYRADGGWNDVIRAVVTQAGATGGNPIDGATVYNLLDRLAKDSGGPWHVAPSPTH